MSKKTDAISNLRGAAKSAAGAHLTRQARIGTAEKFVNFCYEAGYQIRDVRSIGGRHLASYVQSGLDAGRSVRTLQNEMAHLRAILASGGRADFARSERISNAALGIAGSSRAGTKVSATDAQYRAALDAVGRVDAGVAAALRLERELGLRAAEAIRSIDSLPTWERSLRAGERVHVVFGTKGGRDRLSAPADRQRALEAVQAARAVCRANGGHLIAGTLRQAMTRYANVMHRHSPITGHQLRYAYAQDRIEYYLDAGYSRREATALTSIDLGHGDGRGRYVERVYSLR